MAKALYLDKTKQDIYEDWRRFAKINLLPHTQTCIKCNAINDLEYLDDIFTLRYDNEYFLFKCLGCGSHQKFTGGAHLPATIIADLTQKYMDARGPHGYIGFFEYDHPVWHNIGRMALGTVVTAIIGLIIGAAFL